MSKTKAFGYKSKSHLGDKTAKDRVRDFPGDDFPGYFPGYFSRMIFPVRDFRGYFNWIEMVKYLNF